MIRTVVLAGLMAVLIPTAISYIGALTGPGTDSLGLRSVEWLRSHHFRWLVNDVENIWYSHHQPKKGGVPSPALQAQVGGSGSTKVRPVAVVNVAPAPLVPFVSDPIAGEGKWQPLGLPVHGRTAMYATYLRPDDVHTSLVAAVAWINPSLVRAVGYAGAVEPGGSGWTNQLPISPSVRPDLLAVFNSGFKLSDSRGGYYDHGRLAGRMRDGAATLWINSDGVPRVGMWGRDVTFGPDVVFARQNLNLIVDGGAPVPGVEQNNPAQWGWTVGNKILVWRSGVGETAKGDLVYAAGPGLSVYTLARLLARAGAVRAMELDINSAWVAFFTYGPGPPGSAPGTLDVNKLLVDMVPSRWHYLTASSRDAIALFGR